MLVLSASPVCASAKRVLVIVHPQESHSPDIGNALSEIKYESKQIIRVGEHILTENRLHSFDTVLIPPVKETLWVDMLRRLKQHYQDFLKLYANSTTHQLIAYGNAIHFLSKKVLHIPHLVPLRRDRIVRDIDGLNILPFNIDTDFDPQRTDKSYIQEVFRCSSSYTIYLFDASAVYHSQLGIQRGNVYQVSPFKISQIREIMKVKNEKEQKELNKKKIPPMRYIYSDAPMEEKELSVGQTQSINKPVVSR